MDTLDKTNLLKELKELKEGIQADAFAILGITSLDALLIYGLSRPGLIQSKVLFALFTALFAYADVRQVIVLKDKIKSRSFLEEYVNNFDKNNLTKKLK